MSTKPTAPVMFLISTLLPVEPPGLTLVAVQTALKIAGYPRNIDCVRRNTVALGHTGMACGVGNQPKLWTRGMVLMRDPGEKPPPSEGFDWTDERKTELRRLRVDLQQSQVEIAEAWGVTKGVIVGQCNRMKLPSPQSIKLGGFRHAARHGPKPKFRPLCTEVPNPGHVKRLPPSDKEAAFRAMWLARSVMGLAAEFGISRQTVMTWGRNLGLGDRRPAPPPRPVTTPTRPHVVPRPVPRDAPPDRLNSPDHPLWACGWITNDARPWRVCTAPRDGGLPYCAYHWRRAHSHTAERDFTPQPGALNFQAGT
jgi:transposase-like protein